MRLAILQGFEDHSVELVLKSVSKAKLQEGFSWQAAESVTIGQSSLRSWVVNCMEGSSTGNQ